MFRLTDVATAMTCFSFKVKFEVDVDDMLDGAPKHPLDNIDGDDATHGIDRTRRAQHSRR